MALQKTINLNFHGQDVSFSDSYIRVESLRGNKNEMTSVVVTYTSDQGRSIKSGEYTFNPDLSGGNFITQAYAHLKTLTEFAGATDV